MTTNADLELLHELANTADGITLRYFATGAAPAQTKADGTTVTRADREVEQVLRDRLRAGRPDDLVIGEELGVGEELGGTQRAARRWILDPIDGTAHFASGRPEWSTLLAMETDGEVVSGLVSAPALGRRWWATRGAGAWSRTSASSAGAATGTRNG